MGGFDRFDRISAVCAFDRSGPRAAAPVAVFAYVGTYQRRSMGQLHHIHLARMGGKKAAKATSANLLQFSRAASAMGRMIPISGAHPWSGQLTRHRHPRLAKSCTLGPPARKAFSSARPSFRRNLFRHRRTTTPPPPPPRATSGLGVFPGSRSVQGFDEMLGKHGSNWVARKRKIAPAAPRNASSRVSPCDTHGRWSSTSVGWRGWPTRGGRQRSRSRPFGRRRIARRASKPGKS